MSPVGKRILLGTVPPRLPSHDAPAETTSQRVPPRRESFMPSTINCPSCSRALRVPDELLGKNVKCPTYGTTFSASADAEPPAEAPPPVAGPRSGPPPHDEEDAGRLRRRREYVQPYRGTLILVLGILGL